MSLAILCTVMSSLCLALMVTFDRLMVGDCYQGKSNQAWFVSSVAGSLLGLSLTAVLWGLLILRGDVSSLGTLFSLSSELFVGKGIAMLVVGGLSVQVLLHYFRCFSEEANSAAVASWLAATPIFIFLALFLYSVLTGNMTDLLQEPWWIFGVIIATIGLVAFEQFTSGGTFHVKTGYRRELALMLLFNVAYAIMLKNILSDSNGDTLPFLEIVALLPFYWIGFAAGTRVIFKRGEWQTFKSNWKKRLRYFLVPILIVEIVGMLVFYFEYFGLAELDPVYVNIIIGAHVFLVYGIDLALGRVRKWMVKEDIRVHYVAGIRLLQKKLPRPEITSLQAMLEAGALTVTVLGVLIVSFYSLH
jgi:hypothetical protein